MNLPSLGWTRPTPVTALPELADELGLAWLGIKRDDLLEPLHGGTKVRKLDTLLAHEPWASAPAWASLGAWGSGHLASLTEAAAVLGRTVDAYCFWEPITDGALANLARTASGPSRVHFQPTWTEQVLRHPGLWTGADVAGAASIAPGASSPIGTLGVVRAGLELAGQVADGLLPPPDEVWVPLGSGGTAAGLCLGLAMGGLRPTVHAVAVVPWPLATASRVRALAERARAVLPRSTDVPLAPLRVHRSHLGDGYGHPTDAGRYAVDRMRHVLRLELVYSAKAFAALTDLAQPGRRVLFWGTPARAAAPMTTAWRDRLPPSLAARLDGQRISRRGVLVAFGAATAATLCAGLRTTGYDTPGGGELMGWELEVVAAAAEAVVPDQPGADWPSGPDAMAIAHAVDRYVASMPASARAEIHGLLALLEQGTGLNCGVQRLTRMAASDRRAFLERLASLPAPLPQAARGIRDLVYLGFYQAPPTWQHLHYPGPLVDRGVPPVRSALTDHLAPPGALP